MMCLHSSPLLPRSCASPVSSLKNPGFGVNVAQQHPEHSHVISTLMILNPKYSPVPAAGRRINSVPAKPAVLLPHPPPRRAFNRLSCLIAARFTATGNLCNSARGQVHPWVTSPSCVASLPWWPEHHGPTGLQVIHPCVARDTAEPLQSQQPDAPAG